MLKKLAKSKNYSPTVGKEHRPVCWDRGSVEYLRTEHHHNGDRVGVLVCGACGLFAAL